MRLILRLNQNDLNSADDRSFLIFSCDHYPLAARNAGGGAAPECFSFGARHRKQETDGCTAFDAVDQDVAQPLDLRITNGLQTSNPNVIRHSYLLDARERSPAMTTMYRAGLRVR